METPFGKIGIYGVGLIGGSLGLSLRKKGLARSVHGIGRNPERLQEAVDLGAVDTFSVGADDFPPDLEILVLGTHLSVYGEILSSLRPHLTESLIVSDVGSAQSATAREIERNLPRGIPFVGAHPMAGGERGGVAEAREDLFEGAVCALCPLTSTPERAVERIREMWDAVGARTVFLDPATHDRFVAWTSHLPHIAAAALARCVAESIEAEPGAADFLGPGFRDTTRIAAGDPGMWRDICLTNRENLSACLERIRDEIEAYLEAMRSEDSEILFQLLSAARDSRNEISGDE
jgi:prephenate dehydrogenase